ncbi:myo-inositol-1(or 4)-monophosphatase [Pseudochelatococcus lubricantis]|uniref:Myo-inositol-1(Or 4)-monophosphatase n=1 Tax=Pseudochelatococcus lubricantis TaxID=1538102 RepID=A0ABX0V2T4_9HYPH|nr:3'(2'),5'-bisphosphate nucleotidase CysQ [Pseudochelatococcus lubricantis]NIJ59538.1 myo-inositol-1(or 4)-monophosphatase [Pseudochelatococcus lubricantis]
MSQTHPALTDKDFGRVGDAIVEAGRIALSFFTEGARTRAAVTLKNDRSPVTEADIAVDRFLHEALLRIRPDAGWLSEESADDSARLDRPTVWIVDPIDGTRAFAEGARDWAVSVALVHAGQPLAGILWAPALSLRYEARAGAGALRNGLPIGVSRQAEIAGARVAGPRGMLDMLCERGHAVVAMPREPSLALRIARVADAALDAGLASSNAHDWDIAAADIILREAGGQLGTLDGARLRYNTRAPVHGRLIGANSTLAPLLAAALAREKGAP